MKPHADTLCELSELFLLAGKLKVNGLQIVIWDIEATLIYKSLTSFVSIAVAKIRTKFKIFHFFGGTHVRLLRPKHQSEIYMWSKAMDLAED